jgi:signal transduction histidine kinase
VNAIAILLLEDSDAAAERILAVLAQDGPACQVRRARTGEAFASVLAEGPVDLVLAGGSPPGVDTPALLEASRSVRPGVPVVVVPPAGLDGLGPAVRRAVDACEERRRMEAALVEALAASRRKDAFLAHVAHELRTPLNAMLGWASMLRTRRLDESARARALETIERNARAEARMIEDLLDVTSMMTGTLRLDVMEVELCPAVAAVVEAVRPAADAKAISLSAMLDETAGAVAGDPTRLRQLLHELCANAVRATPRSGRVEVRLSRRSAEAEIAVVDSGRGIRADLLPRIFEGFAGADSEAQRGAARRGCLGVGLSIVRHLVEAHGGTVVAESPGEDRGATFTVRLPLLPAEWTGGPLRSPP